MDGSQTTNTIDFSTFSLDEFRHHLKENLDPNRIIDYTTPKGSGKIIRNPSPQERNTYLKGVKYVGFIANLLKFDVWFFDIFKIDFLDVADQANLPIKNSRVQKSVCGYINLCTPEPELIQHNRSRIKLVGILSDPVCCRKHSMFRILKSFEKALIKLKPDQFFFETRGDAVNAFKTSNRKMFFPET